MAVDKKISELPIAGTIDRTNDRLAIVQGGVTNQISPDSLLSQITQTNIGGGAIAEMFTLKVSLTSAQIKTGNSIPVDIGLPVSGAGYYYSVTRFDAKLNFNSVSFDPASSAILIYATSGSTSQMEIDSFLDSGSDLFNKGFQQEQGNNLVENNGVVIKMGGDSTVGDSTIDCYITVQKIKL